MSTPAPEYTLTVDQTGAHLHWQGQTFEVEASDLRDGGWTRESECERSHCDMGECPSCDCWACRDELDPADLDAVPEALKRWHDYESGHAGPFQFCDHEPCRTCGQHLAVRH